MKYLKRFFIVFTLIPLAMLCSIIGALTGGFDDIPWRWWGDYESDYLRDMFNEN